MALPPMAASRTQPAEGSVHALRVRNTFIETTSAERSPSLERFYRRRSIHTCPANRVGAIAASLARYQQEHGYEEGRLGDSLDCGASVASIATCDTDLSLAAGTGVRSGESSAGSAVEAASCWQAQEPGDNHVWLGASPCASPVYRSRSMPMPGAPRPVILLADALPAEAQPVCDPNAVAGLYHAADLDPFGAVLPPHMADDFVLSVPMQGHAAYSWAADDGYMPAPPAAPAPVVVAGVAPGVPTPPRGPAPGTAELPSIGSATHGTGGCKPCAFFHADRCGNGPGCLFCHACPPDERQRRRREKIQLRKEARRLHQLRGAPAC